jgi:hypothetical protein
MTRHSVAFWLAVILSPLATSVVSAQDFYSRDEVLDVKFFWESQVTNVITESIKPSLTGEQLLTEKNIKWEFPTESSDDLIGFGAIDSRVVLPIRSWMFLQDLVVAYLWQDVNGCQPTVLEYSNLLKYRSAASLPGGRYPDPIEAMGIPSPNTKKLAQLSPEFARRLERVFYGIVLFVTAHEVGHVVLGHSGFGSVEKEIAADDFAFSILAKQQVDPSGVMVFFLLTAPLLPTVEELSAMNRKPDHPMSGRRVKALGSRLIDNPEHYYPGAKPSDPRIPMLKEIGSRLIKVGDELDSLSRREELRKAALNTTLSQLITCPQSK